MPVIKCHGCKFSDPTHLVGNKEELLYYSVSSNSAPCGKKFFCTENCYLESVFVEAVVAEASRSAPISPDIHLTLTEMYKNQLLGDIADSMQPHFDEIVTPCRNQYGLDKFKERVALLKKKPLRG